MRGSVSRDGGRRKLELDAPLVGPSPVSPVDRKQTILTNTYPMAGKAKRTTHRSSAGKKLYAVRDAKGKFKDIQTYERAHRADLARKAKKEK